MTAGQTADDLTVVIPTLGRPVLEGCLEALADNDTMPSEVVVVDQSASDAVASLLARLRDRGLPARHVPSTQRGIAAGTNLGFRNVTTPYAAVTHDDCRPHRDWVRTMAAKVRAAGPVILTGRVEPEGDGDVPTFVTSTTPAVYTRPMLDRDVLSPANMGLSLAVFERIGELDEDPLLAVAAEDNDWAYRALRAGVPIVYDPDLVVGHLAWRDEAEVRATYRRYARAQGSLYGKWIRRGDAFMAARAARDLVRGPWLVLRGTATGNHDLVELGRAEVSGIGPGILAAFRRRRTP